MNQYGQPQQQFGQVPQQPGSQQFGSQPQSQQQPGSQQYGSQPPQQYGQPQQQFGQVPQQPGSQQFGSQPQSQQQYGSQQYGSQPQSQQLGSQQYDYSKPFNQQPQPQQFNYEKAQQIPQIPSMVYASKVQGLSPQQQQQITTPGVPQLPPNVTSNNYNYNPNANQWYSSFGMNISPEEMNELQLWFSAVDLDRSGSITDFELQKALSYSGFIFSIKVAQRLIKVFDSNASNHLSFQEFVPLHRFLKQLKRNFENSDVNKSGNIDLQELQLVLSAEGFNISKWETLQKLFNHFSLRVGSGFISFEQYVELVCFLGQARLIFNNIAAKTPTNIPGRINIDLNDLIDIIASVSE